MVSHHEFYGEAELSRLKQELSREVTAAMQQAFVSALRNFGQAIEAELKPMRARLEQFHTGMGEHLSQYPGDDHVRITDFEALVDGFQTKFAVLREEMEIMRGTNGSRGEEATASVQEAPNRDNQHVKKNLARKLRRRRTKQKITVQRSLLLKMRPLPDVSRIQPQDYCPPDLRDASQQNSEELSLLQRVENLENIAALNNYMAGECNDTQFHQEWAFESAISGPALAKQCNAVRIIQRAWRKNRTTYKMKCCHSVKLHILDSSHSKPISVDPCSVSGDFIDDLLNEIAIAKAISSETTVPSMMHPLDPLASSDVQNQQSVESHAEEMLLSSVEALELLTLTFDGDVDQYTVLEALQGIRAWRFDPASAIDRQASRQWRRIVKRLSIPDDEADRLIQQASHLWNDLFLRESLRAA